ncbi:MAG TPA: glycosyltransferase family 9 protein [Euzebyales bacterium]
MALISTSDRNVEGMPRLLVLRALGLGDLLTAVPALRVLRDRYPGHERILAAPAWLAPLVRLLDGAVDALVDVDFRDHVGVLPTEVRLPTVAVNLHGRGPASHLALQATDPGALIAFENPDVAHDGPAWRVDEHERLRWCRLLGATASADDVRVRSPAIDVPDDVRRATIIHPGAAAPARRWPVDRWAAVARHELRRGRQVLVTGGADEVELAKAVANGAGLGGTSVLAGRTDVGELAAVVDAAGRVVCGDTGVAHLASAFATPSVVLFGPVSPTRWGPPRGGPHVALWAGTRGDPHAASPDRGLLGLTVDDVTRALDGLRGEPAPP